LSSIQPPPRNLPDSTNRSRAAWRDSSPTASPRLPTPPAVGEALRGDELGAALEAPRQRRQNRRIYAGRLVVVVVRIGHRGDVRRR
jgi:hypothetical protein